MERVNEIVAQIKKLTAKYEKSVENLLKTANDSNKSENHVDLQKAILNEDVLVTINYLFELKVLVLQMRYDLSTVKDKAKKEKLILEAYHANELYDEQKSSVIKLIKDIKEKHKNMKFTLAEAKAWVETDKVLGAFEDRIKLMILN